MLFRSSRDVLLSHLEHVKQLVPLKNKTDNANAALLESELLRWGNRHRRLSRLRVVVFIFLYASVLSTISVPIVSDVLETILTVTGLLGVGLLSLLVLYLSYVIRETFNKMIVVYSHVIAIYEKHNKAPLSRQHLPA